MQCAARLLDEIKARDAGVGRTIGDKFRDVLGANEQRLKFPAERRGQGAGARGANFETGVREQLTSILRQPALVG